MVEEQQGPTNAFVARVFHTMALHRAWVAHHAEELRRDAYTSTEAAKEAGLWEDAAKRADIELAGPYAAQMVAVAQEVQAAYLQQVGGVAQIPPPPPEPRTMRRLATSGGTTSLAPIRVERPPSLVDLEPEDPESLDDVAADITEQAATWWPATGTDAEVMR